MLLRVLGCAALMVDSVASFRLAKKSEHQMGVAASCGQRRGSPDPMTMDVNISIVNGRPAPRCAWPWQVSLGGCGGTLIAPDWVLSASHCGNPRSVRAGLHNYSDTSVQTRRVVGNYKHPQYNFPKNDIMLLKLDRPFDLNECVNTACLPSTEPPAGKKCWITGWGTLSSGGRTPDILQEASVDIKSQSDCKRAYFSATDDMVCANGRNSRGTTDACQGDSGGPLVCQESGRWYVYGATSYGNGCGNPRYPGVWSRAAYNQQWITQTSGVRPPGGGSPTPPSRRRSPSPTPSRRRSPSPSPSPTPPGGCVDKNPQMCPVWKDRGYCSPSSPFYRWMIGECCRSCRR